MSMSNTLPAEIYRNRHLILKLAKNDLKTRFAGSYLGLVWAFVQPVVSVLIYWLVFGHGLKSGQSLDVPFLVYLVSGIVPWFYFQEVMSAGTATLLEYSYLVKKVVFNIRVLPVVKAFSALFVHLFFVLVALFVAALNGFLPGIFLIQLPYYYFCMLVFVLGLVYTTCSVVVFFRDMSQIVNIALQFGIWSIPIMFDIRSFEHISWLFRINPMYYVIMDLEWINSYNKYKKFCSMALIYIIGSVTQYSAHSKLYKRLMSGNLAARFNYWFRYFPKFLRYPTDSCRPIRHSPWPRVPWHDARPLPRPRHAAGLR